MSGYLKDMKCRKRKKIMLLQQNRVESLAAKKAKICENFIPTTPETTIITASEFEYHIQRFKDSYCTTILSNV